MRKSETNLILSSPDTGMTLTKVLAGTGGAPAATQGSYVLKVTWTGQPDRKVENLPRRFELTIWPASTKPCRCYTGRSSLIPAKRAYRYLENNWLPGNWTKDDSCRTENDRWFTIKMNISSFSPGLLNHISALVFQKLWAPNQRHVVR